MPTYLLSLKSEPLSYHQKIVLCPMYDLRLRDCETWDTLVSRETHCRLLEGYEREAVSKSENMCCTVCTNRHRGTILKTGTIPAVLVPTRIPLLLRPPPHPSSPSTQTFTSRNTVVSSPYLSYIQTAVRSTSTSTSAGSNCATLQFVWYILKAFI